MPSVASNIPSPQLALNNKMNMGLPSIGGYNSSTQTSTPLAGPQTIKGGLNSISSTITPGSTKMSAPLVPFTPVSQAKAPVTAPALPSAPASTYTSGAYTPPASSPTAPVSPTTYTPAYNPSQPATTVYNNGVGTTNQGGTTVSGYTPPTQGTQTSGIAANGGNTNTVIPGQLSTYPGIVSGLAASALQGSPAAQGYTAQTAQYGAGNVPIGQEAAAIGQQYGLDYNAATQAGTSQEGHELTTGGLSGVGEGNAAITASALAQQQQGIAQSADAAFQGLGVQATTQNQAANAANEAAGQAQTGQGLIQSGLGAAGALAQPSATASGQTTFNPLTGQFSGGSSSADPTQAPSGYTQADWSQIVSNVANGNLSAVSGLPTVLQAQAQAAAQAQNPNFNINTAQGQAQGQQAVGAAGGQTQAQNMVTGGTAAVNAGASTFAQANPAYLNLKENVIPNIDNFGTLLTQGAGGINPFSTQYGNMTLQQFQNQLSSPQQAQFNATFQQLQKSIAALAGAGGSQTPTANSVQSDNTLSPTAKMSTIGAVLDRIAQEGNVYLTNQGNLSNAALSQAQGGSTGNTATSGWGSLGD